MPPNDPWGFLPTHDWRFSMPYRSILITLVTVSLALLAAGLWMRSISPMIAEVNASTQPSTVPGNMSHSTISRLPSSGCAVRQSLPMSRIGSGLPAVWIMIATFLVISILFVIGFFTTLRAWMRPPTKYKKTRYVDVWKIAGLRKEAQVAEDEHGAEGGEEEGEEEGNDE